MQIAITLRRTTEKSYTHTRSEHAPFASLEVGWSPIASTEIPRLPDAVAFRPTRADGRDRLALALILLFALVVRAWLARASTMENMDPDAAHFLNIARSFATGHGFTNPAAWPAWMQPQSLPM